MSFLAFGSLVRLLFGSVVVIVLGLLFSVWLIATCLWVCCFVLLVGSLLRVCLWLRTSGQVCLVLELYVWWFFTGWFGVGSGMN